MSTVSEESTIVASAESPLGVGSSAGHDTRHGTIRYHIDVWGSRWDNGKGNWRLDSSVFVVPDDSLQLPLDGMQDSLSQFQSCNPTNESHNIMTLQSWAEEKAVADLQSYLESQGLSEDRYNLEKIPPPTAPYNSTALSQQYLTLRSFKAEADALKKAAFGNRLTRMSRNISQDTLTKLKRAGSVFGLSRSGIESESDQDPLNH